MDKDSVRDLREEQEEMGRPRPHELTLADVVIERRIGHDVTRYTGAQIARLIDTIEQGPDEHEPYVSRQAIMADLRGLAEIQAALSAAAHRETELPLSPALDYVAEQLRRLAQRVGAFEPCHNRRADWYRVEVTKPGPQA